MSKRENSWTNIGYRLGGSEFVGGQAEKEIWRVGEREGGREGTEEEEEEMGKRRRGKRQWRGKEEDEGET